MIEDQKALESLVAEQRPQRVVVDTEYESRGRYRGVLGLVQLAWDGHWAIIDPLQVELSPLVAWAQAQWVTHDGSQDWGLLLEAGMVAPARLFDTQLAARLLGSPFLGLAKLMEAELGGAHDKSSQRSDWLRRPLSEAQLEYARQDVLGLERLTDHLEERLRAAGRLDALEEEGTWAIQRWCRVGHRAVPSVDKFKRLRRATPLIRGRGQALLAWREAEGYRKNKPVKWLLPDDELVALACEEKAPSDSGQKVALAQAQPLPRSSEAPMTAEQRQELKRLKANRQVLAEAMEIDPTLLAPPAVLEAIVKSKQHEMAHGWRAPFLDQLSEPTGPAAPP